MARSSIINIDFDRTGKKNLYARDPKRATGWPREESYQNQREIGGVRCATMDMATTRALVVGITPHLTYERRYCYQNREEADAALAAYTDTSGHPPGNWIKVKGQFRGEHIDALNPRHPDLQPWDKVAPE